MRCVYQRLGRPPADTCVDERHSVGARPEEATPPRQPQDRGRQRSPLSLWRDELVDIATAFEAPDNITPCLVGGWRSAPWRDARLRAPVEVQGTGGHSLRPRFRISTRAARRHLSETYCAPTPSSPSAAPRCDGRARHQDAGTCCGSGCRIACINPTAPEGIQDTPSDSERHWTRGRSAALSGSGPTLPLSWMTAGKPWPPPSSRLAPSRASAGVSPPGDRSPGTVIEDE